MSLRRPLRYKADAIWDTPDDGNRYEVIDGALYVTPPPNWGHQYGLGRLFLVVAAHVYERGLGKVVTAPVGVVLDADNGVEPDLVYVSNERLHLISERGVEGAPDLVVEVLSPSTRSKDRGVKLRRYAAAGVPHYWMLDPRTRTLEARRLGTGGYELVGTYSPGAVFRPELFPGLEIPIDALWA
jgi:Uma2 family endonuclease